MGMSQVTQSMRFDDDSVADMPDDEDDDGAFPVDAAFPHEDSTSSQ